MKVFVAVQHDVEDSVFEFVGVTSSPERAEEWCQEKYSVFEVELDAPPRDVYNFGHYVYMLEEEGEK